MSVFDKLLGNRGRALLKRVSAEIIISGFQNAFSVEPAVGKKAFIFRVDERAHGGGGKLFETRALQGFRVSGFYLGEIGSIDEHVFFA